MDWVRDHIPVKSIGTIVLEVVNQRLTYKLVNLSISIDGVLGFLGADHIVVVVDADGICLGLEKLGSVVKRADEPDPESNSQHFDRTMAGTPIKWQ